MNVTRRFLLAAALAVAPGVASAQPIKVAGVLELSGPGAGVGNNQKHGLELAVKEINAAGGILGRPIELRFYDNQTNPGVSRAQLQKALDDEPYVIVGPTFSGAAKASMPVAQQAGVPQFTGGTAPELTEVGNPYLFRSYMSQRASVPKLADYIKNELKAQSVALIWANTDFGKGGRDTFRKEAAARGLKIVTDVSTELGQADFASDVLRARDANADVVFLYVHEEEAARFLREAKKQNLRARIIGESTLLNPKVLELAGDAGVGARGFVGLSGDAPVKAMQDFAAKFNQANGYLPDHNGFQGYMVAYAVKEITERLGKVDRKAFADTLRGATITAEQEPGILLTTTWLPNGDTDRDAFLGEVVEGNKIKIIQTLPRTAK